MSFRRIKMRFTHIVKALLFYMGLFAVLRIFFPSRKVAILCYHAVVDDNDNNYTAKTISISKAAFESHVRYFAAKYNVISLDEAIEALRTGRSFPVNAVVFTFDDGYADNFHAAEILAQYKATGTFYLTAACIDRTDPFWLSEITKALLTTQAAQFSINVNGESFTLQLSSEKEKWYAVRHLVKLVKNNNRETREEIRKQLREQLTDISAEKINDELMLTWNQVKEMAEKGMTIGAHTMTHLNLPNADPADAHYEIAESKALIKKHLKKDVLHFSYPNSGPYKYFTPSIRDMVEKCGFHSSATSMRGFVDKDSDLFALKRVRTVPSLVETIAGLELAKLK